MKSIKEDVPAKGKRENETRRLNLQSKLAEKVVDVREDKTAHKKARDTRFKATGEGQCESVEKS